MIARAHVREFIAAVSKNLEKAGQAAEILQRAMQFAAAASGSSLEISFIGRFATLESVLTFFRRKGDYEILHAEDFARLERDLRKWLKAHPLLGESAKRALIYEKIRELNRFPFSHVFRSFCEQKNLDLSDLWPVLGGPADWSLMEIRHRFVHGDPFSKRPAEAVTCANTHLGWVVERMLLIALGWPIERSNASPEQLSSDDCYRNWAAERAKLA